MVELSNAKINHISAAGKNAFEAWDGVPNLLWSAPMYQ